MSRSEINDSDFDHFDKEERAYVELFLKEFRMAERRIDWHKLYHTAPKKKLIEKYNSHLWLMKLLRDLEE